MGFIFFDRFAAIMAYGWDAAPADPFLQLIDTALLVGIAFPMSLAVMWQLQRRGKALAALQETNRSLLERANRDHVTGFHNRDAFFDRFGTIRRKTDRGALLLIDADRFKAINDTYGHLTGDRALRTIARAIQRSVRECDVVGRVGGEEFCVFLPLATRTEAGLIAERLRAAVEQAVFRPPGSTPYRLSVSIGVAFCSGPCTLTQLMRRADLCLYKAKKQGRNKVVMDETLEEDAMSLA